MKIHLAALLSFAVGGTATALGQAPAAPRPHSLSLHVEPVSSGGTSTVSDRSHTRAVPDSLDQPARRVRETKSTLKEVNERSESLRVDVRNFGVLPDSAQVEYYFMARLVKGGQGDYILDEGARPVTVAPGATATIPVESKKVTETITRRSNTHLHNGRARLDHGSDRDSGSTMTGWMVRVVADGRVLDARGSKDDLEQQAKDLSRLPIIK